MRSSWFRLRSEIDQELIKHGLGIAHCKAAVEEIETDWLEAMVD
jgi:hypothetical protein